MATLQHTKKIISPGKGNNALIWLIIANIVVLVSILLVKIIYYLTGSTNATFYNGIVQWIVLPSNINQFITRPWTILTYMFTHISIWQLLSNMLWLWAFGYILKDLISSRKLIPIYIYGGFAGAAIYIIAYNTIPAFKNTIDSSMLLGASASVMAIAVATTTLTPNYRIFPFINRGIPLWVLTVVFIIINIATTPINNPVIHLANASGGTMGFIFIWQLKKGYDWSRWIDISYNWLNNLCNPNKKPKKDNTKKSYFKNKVQPFSKTPHITQQKVDELLDKINQYGYSSLTADEKKLLRKASKYL